VLKPLSLDCVRLEDDLDRRVTTLSATGDPERPHCTGVPGFGI
jgi:hypothetical protein